MTSAAPGRSAALGGSSPAPLERNHAEALRAAERAASSLTLYSGVLDDPVGRAYAELVDALTPGSPDGAAAPPSVRPSRLYRRLFALLADERRPVDPSAGDAWQVHLLDRCLADENAFSRRAEAAPFSDIPAAVRSAAAADLVQLRRLFEFAGAALRAAVLRREPDDESLPDLHGLRGSGPVAESPDAELRRRFAAAADWPDLLEPLAGSIRARGLGMFGEFRAFRWTGAGGAARLEGVALPDPVRLDDLVGYDAERRLMLQNTEHFLAGLSANNVLLYGDRGTGKSSTVKAILNEYASRGLRMVEVRKEQLDEFPRILRMLRDRPERFVLFIDDLSFEEHETHYKELKALLEGGLEARPANLLLYATSNRRHLIRERFSDRISPLDEDEIHANDTSEEKLSLSDRFGITLTFMAPTQEGYLAIVRSIASARGIAIPEGELASRAIAWAVQRGARSGRVARQFVDHLGAELEFRDSGLGESQAPGTRQQGHRPVG